MENQVGLVPVFAGACDTMAWKQMGQDLLGSNQLEGVGHVICSSHDGHVMALPVTQGYDIGTGFVEYYIHDGNHWDMLGQWLQDIDSVMAYYGLLLELI